jgi:formylglycine-generating enzyme required for sulfatase activity
MFTACLLTTASLFAADDLSLVPVPAGRYDIGPNNYVGSAGGAKPKEFHNYYDLSAYAIGRYEITNRTFCELLNWGLQQQRLRIEPAGVLYGDKVLLDLRSNFCRIRHDGSRLVVIDGFADHPAIEVSWHGAMVFCALLNDRDRLEQAVDVDHWTIRLDKNGYRLPTEVEWEAAAMGGVPHQQHPWDDGDSKKSLVPPNVCNCTSNNNRSAGTKPIGSYPPTGFGTHDMLGNVWEWCADQFVREEELYSAAGTPPRPGRGGKLIPSPPILRDAVFDHAHLATQLKDGETRRVLRGGAWNMGVGNLVRTGDLPSLSLNDLGFRIARSGELVAPAKLSAQRQPAAEILKSRGFTDIKVDRDGHITSLKVGSKNQVFTNEDLATLKNEDQIVSVELSGDFTASGVAHLAGKTTIEKLVLGSSVLTDEVSTTLATLTGLKELKLFGNLTSDWANQLAGKMPNLEAITVNGRDPDGRFTFPRETAAAFRHLPSFPKLRAFNPGQHHIYYINNEVIATLAQCPNLEILNMGGSTWGAGKTTVDYRPLLACKKLNTFVQFHASLFHDPTCQVLSQLPEMKKIVLDFVTDDGVKELAKLPKLETLQLGDSLIGPAGIQALSQCRSLRRLEITGSRSYAILDDLKELKQLTSLTWTARPGGDETERALQAALPKTKIVLTDTKGERATVASLRASWEKSDSRLKSQKQLQPFFKAVEAYRAAYPLSEN